MIKIDLTCFGKWWIVILIFIFVVTITTFSIIGIQKEVSKGVSHVQEKGLKNIIMPVIERVWEGDSIKKKE